MRTSAADWYATQLFTRTLIHSLSPPISSHGTSVKHRSGPFHRVLVALGLNKSARHARDVLSGDLENADTFFSKKDTEEADAGGVGIVDDGDDGSSLDERERAGDERLDTPGTLLRSTEECSMLLQALLDVVVDEVLELTEEFRRELDVLEGRALVRDTRTNQDEDCAAS